MTTQQNSLIFLLRSVNGEQQLPVAKQLKMGRSAECDVVLDQGGASRQHAVLTPDPEGVWVEDSGSTNGTFVNGERIEQACLLKEGDQLQVGQSIFTLFIKAPVVEQDPDATLLYGASADPDATLLHGDLDKEEAQVPEEAPFAKEVPDDDSKPEAGDSKAPPSWVLNNQQSVDGTAFFSKDSLPGLQPNSEDQKIPQQAVDEPTLIGTSDPVVGLRFQLIGEGKNQWEIGRSPNSDVMLNHESVSGAHAQIINDAGRWKVVDLMSANGTYANGKKCLTGYLSSGDLVCFGSVECAFMLPEGEQQPEPMVESRSPTKVSGTDIKTAAIAFIATAAAAGLVLLIVTNFF
ncbi:FHA domain-containing protein [Marinobacter sp. 1-4A]|uniref:FHA domain-containing protein n=1 Tax=Marinobacter sp. 1-4A TaxID=2582919 RepID=UPI00190556F3|nr:FHA domain-containing protein [Marinobacter sp. 1-4A]MBK1851819.1 FHA domain-containing protein [Marinobacter sp. 1-4A]